VVAQVDRVRCVRRQRRNRADDCMVTQVMVVSHVWHELARRQGCARPAAEAVLDQLLRAYAEPHRHYHTIDHIASLLRLLDEHGDGVIDRNAVALAILFHDVVYDPARHDNEQISAGLVEECLAPLGFKGKFVAKIERYILATQHGQDLHVSDDPDLALRGVQREHPRWWGHAGSIAGECARAQRSARPVSVARTVTRNRLRHQARRVTRRAHCTRDGTAWDRRC